MADKEMILETGKNYIFVSPEMRGSLWRVIGYGERDPWHPQKYYVMESSSGEIKKVTKPIYNWAVQEA